MTEMMFPSTTIRLLFVLYVLKLSFSAPLSDTLSAMQREHGLSSHARNLDLPLGANKLQAGMLLLEDDDIIEPSSHLSPTHSEHHLVTGDLSFANLAFEMP